jgi:arylsulfatase A-like enzyme
LLPSALIRAKEEEPFGLLPSKFVIHVAQHVIDGVGQETMPSVRRIDSVFSDLWEAFQMVRRGCFGVIAFLLLWGSCGGFPGVPAVAAAEQRPNVLVILADDLGYADVGVHGCQDIPTPNIDALAASGVRCTDGYASHPFCSPTRAGLMSARYQHRFGYVTNVAYDPQNPRIGLPVEIKTVAQRLKQAGYVTGMAGKWHLGASHLHHPNRRGFEDFFGFLGGGHDYFTVDLRIPMAEGYRQPLDRNGSPEGLSGYLTDALADHAVDFIQAHRQQPFFYYLAFNAPHTPLQAPEEAIAKFAAIQDEKRRRYAAMVHRMDMGIGRVLAALQESGVRRQTLVFFLSDNGGPTFANASRNDPLRGVKGQVYEGGIRVPFLAAWPDALPQGAVYRQPIVSFDIASTALAVAGVVASSDDEGVNLIPYLAGRQTEPPHGSLFFRKDDGQEWAVRSGRWKLIGLDQGQATELYDLESDLGESSNVADQHPEIAAALAEQYAGWDTVNPKPLFPGYRVYHDRKKAFYEQMEFAPSQVTRPKSKGSAKATEAKQNR